MKNRDHGEPSTLYQSFREITLRQFAFLRDEFGMTIDQGWYSHRIPIPQLKAERWTPTPFDLYVCRICNENILLDVSYGDRESGITASYYVRERKEWFGAWEIVDAAKRSIDGLEGRELIIDRRTMTEGR